MTKQARLLPLRRAALCYTASMSDRQLDADFASQASQALLIETLAANAWPPEQSIVFDGWRLRSARGVTRRANSVWPNADGALVTLDQKLAVVERYYAALGQQAIFQICAAAQPAALDTLLDQRGYAIDAPTHVQTAAIAQVMAHLPPQQVGHHADIEISRTFDRDWFALYCACEEVGEAAASVRRAILERIQPTHGFALLRRAGEPIAVGLGVVEDGWLGIFCMATLPAYRRQGAAGAILHSLAAWSHSFAAKNAYLQVMVNNHGAQQMYAKAGFVTAYDYHYRVGKETH